MSEKNRPTPEQRRAIEHSGKDLLLSAAAGSGKTATMVARILRLVREGIDLDRMLVVTFTKAAAADMRRKLAKELSALASDGEDRRAAEQLLKLEQAQISTLHSFCSQLVHDHFEAADTDPDFRILEEADTRMMTEDAVKDALREAYSEQDEDLKLLSFGRGPDRLAEMVIIMMGFLRSRPDPKAWLERVQTIPDSLWYHELAVADRRIIRRVIADLEAALALGGSHYREDLNAILAMLRELNGIGDPEELMVREADLIIPTAPRRKPKSETAEEKEIYDLQYRIRTQAVKTDLTKLTLRSRDPERDRRDAAAMLREVCALGRIAMRAEEILEERKAEQGALTFDDLEHRALRVLRDPVLRASVRGRYEYVFVDEYQDTSEIQEELLNAVAGPGRLFAVGDVKQSIYRFRNAEPALFLRRESLYREHPEEGTRLILSMNFRSLPGILTFTNAVFSRLMADREVADLEYDEDARLNLPPDPDPEKLKKDRPVELWLVGPGEEKEDPSAAAGEEESEAEEFELAEQEGILIARLIRERMEEDPSLHYRDFAVLTRQKASAFGRLEPVLTRMGIPCYAEGVMGYYETPEIRLVCSVLRLIDRFRSDPELIGALRSCVCGLSMEELARIRLYTMEGSYAEAVLRYAKEKDDPIADRLRLLLGRLDRWRMFAGEMSLDRLVRIVTEESGIYAYVGALEGGSVRQANIDRLILRARDYDRDVSGSLTRFLALSEELRIRGDAEKAQVLGENDDVVRLMTVHHSKGLQFRVVIGARLNARLMQEKKDDSVLAHRELGVGLMYMDPELRTRRNTLPRQAILERIRREEKAEELRVLYVLLTRAEEQLILIGSDRKAAEREANWRSYRTDPTQATSMFGMMIAALDGDYDSAACRFRTVCTDELTVPPRERIQEPEEDPEPDPELVRLYSWRYPWEGDELRPLKLTATGLLRGIQGPANPEPLALRPRFMTGRSMTATERGTAYHKAVQQLDLASLGALHAGALREAVRDQLDELARQNRMTEQERRAVDPAAIAAFLDRPVGMRMRAAKDLRRELTFNVPFLASEVLAEEERVGSDGELLVQGSIDCCFIEGDEWVLLDYKTNRAEDIAALREYYRRQLELYAAALERITGKKVKDRYLCLISMGIEIAV